MRLAMSFGPNQLSAVRVRESRAVRITLFAVNALLIASRYFSDQLAKSHSYHGVLAVVAAATAIVYAHAYFRTADDDLRIIPATILFTFIAIICLIAAI